MSVTQECQASLVQRFATLLRNYGDSVLDGSSTVTLQVTYVQHLARLFEQCILCTNQQGLVALPSPPHSADTTMLREVQFVFDMLQKTISLKLVQLPGVRMLSVVKIFPFKSLKHLELKRIPSRCLAGLDCIYSQLEVFICSKSLNLLKELLVLCGGDFGTVVPWIKLHTLNFSYNNISCLDKSLRLLNVLRSLDLSHNKIQECAEFLKPLCELRHLRLAYNKLQRTPELGLNTRATLVTLVLRHNQIESINGVEHLSSLHCLDLAYNLLMEHHQLAPLAFLHNLNLLILEGNPLYFRKAHRNSTMYHLSSQAAFRGLQLDGSTLSSTELAIVTHNVPLAPEQTVEDMLIGVGELNDSLPISECGASRYYKRKPKNMKVRTASIFESSNTACSSSPLHEDILWHQKDIEKLDNFRKQMGEDWLQYQHHLYGMPDLLLGLTLDGQLIAENNCTPLATLTKSNCTMLKYEPLPVPVLSPKLKKEKQGIMKFHTESESTLLWTNYSFLDKASDASLQDPQNLKKAFTETAFGEDDDLGVDLCRPMLVRVLSEMKDSDTRKELEPLFLRVHQAYILEVDMHQGCVKSRFELDSLRGVTSSHATWTEKGKESFYSVLELHFSYISHERQRRHYLMMDDDPQEALQVLLELLSKIAVENEHRAKKKNTEIVWMHCLSCQAKYEDRTEKKHTSGDAKFCPECNSDRVIQLAGQVYASTSMLCGQNNDRFDYIDDQKGYFLHRPIYGGKFSKVFTPPKGTTDTFLTEQCGLFNRLSYFSENCANRLISFSSDSLVLSNKKESKFGLAENSSGSLSLLKQKSCQYTQRYVHAVKTVDHRLKLFLDMEVFETEEEIRFYQKMTVVKFGYPEEVPSFVVVSSQRIYILEMTSHLKELNSECLQKKNSHQLYELSYLRVGLGSQSIHMEFDVATDAYTLLIRDRARCEHFFNQLTTLARECIPKLDSKIKIILNTQLNPKHHLWPLVYENGKTGNEEDGSSPFFYLLAFLQLGDSLTSVSVLATKETLFLLNEAHQWIKSCFRQFTTNTSSRVTVHERQPISHVSSVHLFSSEPCQVAIQFYDELAKEERTWLLRAESVKGIQSLINWIKDHWESMFGVKLITSFQL